MLLKHFPHEEDIFSQQNKCWWSAAILQVLTAYFDAFLVKDIINFHPLKVTRRKQCILMYNKKMMCFSECDLCINSWAIIIIHFCIVTRSMLHFIRCAGLITPGALGLFCVSFMMLSIVTCHVLLPINRTIGSGIWFKSILTLYVPWKGVYRLHHNS